MYNVPRQCMTLTCPFQGCTSPPLPPQGSANQAPLHLCPLFLGRPPPSLYQVFRCQLALVVKNPPASSGDIRDLGLTPGLGRSPGGRHGSPLQYTCLENLMDRGAQWATIHRVAKSQTGLKQVSTHQCQLSCGFSLLIQP